MFRILARLGEVSIGGLKHGILIPVPELSLHGSVAGLCAFVLFYGSLFAVLILEMGHE
jgi:hypothetical protein